MVIAILALGKPILVPIALAFYFAFVLTPPSEALERIGFTRLLSLATVIGVMLAVFAVLGSVLSTQISELASQLQSYSTQITLKVGTFREGHLGPLANLSETLSQLAQAVLSESRSSSGAPAAMLVHEERSAFERLEGSLRPVVEPIAAVGVVLVLTIFVLARREDLRGRLIQLLGPQNVTVTTRTMSEAVNRISHLLLTQAYINAGFGSVLALGLWLIGIPYALLWGVMAGVLRFVPLLGALIAVVLPSLVAFASFPGWVETALTVGLILSLDLITGNFVEPWVVGKRTGVSSVALLISTLFWTWLWGPVGLVLATPLTVCATVIGRHVPSLSFLAIVLSDEPGLKAEVDFYQRLLARATYDAFRTAQRAVTKTSLLETLDVLLRPALMLMARDHNQQAIDDEAAERLVKDMSGIVDKLKARPADLAPAASHGLLGVPAESRADALLLKMLSVVTKFESLPVQPRDEAAAEIVKRKPKVLCIAALPPGGGANARFLCRKVRAQLPELQIVVLLPVDLAEQAPEAAARLREAGASEVVADLREAHAAMQRLLTAA